MVIKISAILLSIIFLSGCVFSNMAKFDVCRGGTCAKTNGNNPYVKRVAKIDKNSTTKDEIVKMFGEPLIARDISYQSISAKNTELWEYKSDAYESATYRGGLVTGNLSIIFSGDTVEKVGFREHTVVVDPLYDPRIYTAPEEKKAILALRKQLKLTNRQQIKDGEAEIPIGIAQKSLLGVMKGSACNKNVDIAISVNRAYRKVARKDLYKRSAHGVTVLGSYKSIVRSDASKKKINNAPLSEVPLKGIFELYGGFLHLSSANGKIELDLVRDVNGNGWMGAIAGDDFKGCRDIMLTGENGVTTDKLPPVSGLLAFKRAEQLRNDSKTRKKTEQIFSRPTELFMEHWLLLAEKLGHSDAPHHLGVFYEKKAKDSPEYYKRAINYYQYSAGKLGDVRSQQSLANIYTVGRGVTANLDEALRWRDMASKTHKRAAELCKYPQAITAMRGIIQSEQKKLKLLEFGLALSTGIQMDSGIIRIIKISAGNVVSLDKPFVCKIEGQRLDPRADASMVPEFIYGGTDQFGDYYYDNSLNKFGKTLIAGTLDTLLNNLPYVDNFNLEPLGGYSYKLSPKNSSRESSKIIELR